MLRRLTILLVALCAIFACGGDSDDNKEDDNQWREDVIQCEEAVARLEKCCPGFDGSRVLCNYYFHFTGGCGSSTTDAVNPALNLSESGCIIATSCDDMVSKGICDRAQDATTYTAHVVTDNGDATVNDQKTHPAVCK